MKKLTVDRYAEQYYDPSTVSDALVDLYESEQSDFMLPKRKRVSHKYSYGRALVIAGSRDFPGAPVLAANACERSGAGLTRLMVPESIYTVAAIRCDGAVVTPLPATKEGGISSDALPQILEQLKKAQACLIGPGLGTGADSKALVRAVLRRTECPLVMDADALSVCAGEPEMLSACRAPLILTPHEGEFKHLGGNLTRGRLSGVLRFAEDHSKLILILKGYGTLICRRSRITVNPTGGPAMAKGGSGDVLGGCLCALLAQGFDPWLAACCAVWLHGCAGDLATEALGEYSLTPSDLIRYLPEAFRKITETR